MKTADVQVLLAEDSRADVEMILQCLGALTADHRVHVVTDGEEALDFLNGRGRYAGRADAAPPWLVLLDVKLPKVNGLEVLRTIKEDPRTRAVPVVMLTSSNVERDVARGYRYGANSYVQKPMDFARLREVVRLIGAYWLTVNEPPPAEAFDPEAT
jgi:CheY-like chemotaxis protein